MQKIKGSGSFSFRNAKNDEHQKKYLKGNSLDMFQGPISIMPQNISGEAKPEDFAFFPYRHLSATIVGGGSWKATDFSNEKVLKAGMKLLQDKPVYKNHLLEVDNEVGFVGPLQWTKSYTNSKGDVIPAGIDGPIVIDTVAQPELARKMSGPNPLVRHCSVTVVFDWEASHEFEDEWDFFPQIGDTIDGKMVTRVVTKITQFYETSLVWLGADPYAGALDENGEVKYVDKGGVVELSAENPLITDLYKEGNRMINKGTFYENVNQLSFNKTDKPKDMFKKIIALKLGKSEDELTEDSLNSFEFVDKEEFASFKANKISLDSTKGELELAQTKVANLETEKTDLSTKVVSLETEVEELKPQARRSAEMFKKRVDYAVEMYTKSTDTPDENILNDIKETSSFELIESKIKMYGGQALNSFKATCGECGSEEVSFRSSEPKKPEGNDGGETSEMDFKDQMIYLKNK